MSISEKIAKNVDYSQNFRKVSIWVNNIHENLDFDQNCRKILILVNILENS